MTMMSQLRKVFRPGPELLINRSLDGRLGLVLVVQDDVGPQSCTECQYRIF